MKLRVGLTIAVAALLACPAVLADEKLDAIEKEIVAKWKPIKTMTANMTVEFENQMGAATMKGKLNGKIEVLRKDDKTLLRQETTMTMSGAPNAPEGMTMEMLMVSDGEIAQTLMEQMGQKIVRKMRADQAGSHGTPMDVLESLKKTHVLTVADDAEVEKEKCWVVNAVPKQPQPNAPTKMIHYFRQKDGAMVKMDGFNKDGKAIMKMTMTDIKTNVDIDPKRFEFEVPEGAMVQDMTNMPMPGGQNKP